MMFHSFDSIKQKKEDWRMALSPLESRRAFLTQVALAPIVFRAGNSFVTASLAEQAKGTRNLIYVVFDGGLSQELWDPKPDSPSEVNGDLKAIHTSIPGVCFSELSPELARRADKLTILREVVSPSVFHEDSSEELLWGPNRSFSLSRHAEDLGGRFPVAYVESSFPGYGDGLPGEFNAVRENIHPMHAAIDRLPITMDGETPVLSTEIVNPQRLRRKLQLLDELQRDSHLDTHATRIAQTAREKAERLLLEGFTTTREIDPRLREKFGFTDFGTAAFLAFKLAKSGVAAIDLRIGHWDFHERTQELLRLRFPEVDRVLAALIDAIEETERDIVVCATTELGRDPKINKKAGREHWPNAHSQFFYGGKFQSGKVIGRTDDMWDRTSEGFALRDVKHLVSHGAGGKTDPQDLGRVKYIFDG